MQKGEKKFHHDLLFTTIIKKTKFKVGFFFWGVFMFLTYNVLFVVIINFEKSWIIINILNEEHHENT